MALKETIILWNDGVLSYKEGQYQDALGKFEQIPESARIHYNMACVHLQMNNEDKTLKHLTDAIKIDSILVIAYYLRGLVLLNMGRAADAMDDFEKCILWMRGNAVIDYKQLGLLHKLYACEILYHQAVTHQRLGDRPRALEILQLAEEKQVETKHKNCITQALLSLQNDQSTEVKTMPIPIACIFNPPKSLTQNLAKRDYLGKAEVISSYEASDKFVGFDGPRNIEERRAKTPSPSFEMGKRSTTLNIQTVPIRVSRSFESLNNEEIKSHTLARPKKLEEAFSDHVKIMKAFTISNSETKNTGNSSDKPSDVSSNSNGSRSSRPPPPAYPPPPLPQIILTEQS